MFLRPRVDKPQAEIRQNDSPYAPNSAELHCIVKGKINRIIWYFNGIVLRNNDRIELLENSTKLLIRDVRVCPLCCKFYNI